MEMQRRNVIENAKKAVVKMAIHNKYNITGKHIGNKLLFCFSLIALLFAFGCKQQKTGSVEPKYTVKHYQENIDNDEFTLKESEEKTGKAGENTNAEAKQYEGFTSQPFEQVKINQDGSTIVEIKYKRSIVSIIINLNGGKTTTTMKDGEGGKKLLEGKFGAEVELQGLSKANHTLSKWEPELPRTFPSSSLATVYAAMWTSHPDEMEHSAEGLSFKMKLIKEVADAVLGDKAQDDNKEHNVSLSSYYIGETEVTQELWQVVMGSNPSNFKESFKNPVEQVSWFDCVRFCNELTKKVMKEEDCVYNIEGTTVTADFNKKGFRLPTEAEWEYAAMGGEKSKYAGCNEESELSSYAWYKANSDNKPHQVETKQANKFGLFDMSGNVWEWCWDWYDNSTPTEGKDPVGAVSGVDRIIRGGSWRSVAADCGCSSRLSDYPDVSYNHLGLRLACRP